MASISHAPTTDTEPLFVCEILDADEQYVGWLVDTGEPKKTRSGKIRTRVRYGIILYVRLVSGSLPSPVAYVDAGADRYTAGTARFASGAYAPTPARVITTSGHVYEMTLLGSFLPLCELPPATRALFHPACNAGPESRPVILDSGAPLIDAFRPCNAQLIAHRPPAPLTAAETPLRRTHRKRQARRQREQMAQAYTDQFMRYAHEKQSREFAVRRLIPDLGPDAALDPLLAALTDELGGVRDAAAYELGKIAQRLPVAPFLSAIRDRGWLNAAVCYVAAHVFLTHIDEVPVAALLDLYAGGADPWYTCVHATALEAMGRLSERATDEVVALLASVADGTSRDAGLVKQWSAAKALEALGPRAPVDALIAVLHSSYPAAQSAAARALLRHPAPIPEEILEEARVLSDYETAERIHYAKIRERLNQQGSPQRDEE